MKNKLILLLLTAMLLSGFTSDKPAYNLFDAEGRKVNYSKMIKAMEKADIVFFGEQHTDPVAHWLQAEIAKDLYSKKKDAFILGAEMFEADDQLILNEYLEGLYEEDKYKAEMKLWGNYETDYRPLVEFAREHGIPFIATNIPRRYASVVHYKGFEALDNLTSEAKSYMAPLPILYDPEVKCYKDMLEMPAMGKPGTESPAMDADTTEIPAGMRGAMPDSALSTTGMPAAMSDTAAPMKMPAGPPHGMGTMGPPMENLPKAQAAKDATMAYFILKNWEEGKTLFHLNGSYHSDHFEGIVWHLKQQERKLKIVTLGSVQQKKVDVLEEENLQLADFILCVPANMTRTNR